MSNAFPADQSIITIKQPNNELNEDAILLAFFWEWCIALLEGRYVVLLIAICILDKIIVICFFFY